MKYFKNLRNEMEKNDVTQHKIAILLNTSNVTVWEKLNKKRQWKKDEIDKLIKLFNKPYDYLFKQ